MIAIYDITKKIDKEMDCAENYVNSAALFKLDEPTLCDLYIQLATEEVEHANKLHTKAVELINKAKAAGMNATEGMMETWKKEHVEYVDRMAKIKYMIAEFKR